MPDIVKVLIFSIIAYLFLFIIAKLLGKKQIAQLTFIDYVVGITIGSIAAEMATETEKPFYHYLLAMAIFFLFDLAVSLLGRKGAFMKKLVVGKPLIIINNGEVDYAMLKKSKLTIDELGGLARDKDYFDMNDIAYAILETKGTLSIIPKANKTPVIAENFDITLPPPSLPVYVVTDGKACKDTLKDSGLTTDWLLNKLGKTDLSQLEDILWAEYDDKTDNLSVKYKLNADEIENGK